MALYDTLLLSVGLVCLLGILVLIVRASIIRFVLKRWGKSTKAKVMNCIEVNMKGGPCYLVTCDFTNPIANGIPRTVVGKKLVRWALAPKEIVAIRYWVRFPKVNRMFERTC